MFSRLIIAAVAAYAAYELFRFFRGTGKEDDVDGPPQTPRHPQSHRPFSTPVDQRRFNYSRTYQVQTDAQTYLRVVSERNSWLDQPARTPIFPDDEQEEWQPESFDSSEESDPLLGWGLRDGVRGAHARAMADEEHKSMKKCRRDSRQAYKEGDHPRAQQLSKQATHHKQEMERYHAEASAVIFEENNRGRAPWDVDLHGLRVEEAIARVKITITNAIRRADPKVRLVVGQGKHSEGGIPRLKPKVQEVVQSLGHRVCMEPGNPGVLIVGIKKGMVVV